MLKNNEKAPGESYLFDDVVVDCRNFRVQKQGVAQSLAPRAFDVLRYLIEQRGRVVEKQELFENIWQELFVTDDALTRAVKEIRRALGDDATAPRYVETVPKRGYRFIAELQTAEGAPHPETENIAPIIVNTPPELIETAPGAETPLASLLTVKRTPLALLFSQHTRPQLLLGILAIFILAASAGWFYAKRQPALTEKDTILLADFENQTGDAIFDGMLKQGLAIQLRQSPFLNLFPEARVQQTLREMNRPPDTRVTAALAREICERQNLKALIAGVIAPLGSHYVITIEAINGQSGESLAHQQVEAESREQVLQALSQTARQLREKLGESLSLIQRFDKPLEQATTSKLEAFKAWSLGIEHSYGGRVMEAIPFYKRAVELDPNFAQAWSVLSTIYYFTSRPELAAEYAEKGYALRDRVGEYEKLRITNFYHGFATGDLNKRLEVLALLKQMYPREAAGSADFAGTCILLGQYEQAVAAGREAIRVNPHFAPSYSFLVRALVRLNHFDEARELLAQAFQQKLDNTFFHALLYEMAFIDNDAAEMQRQLDWTRGKLDEYMAFDWQAGAAVYGGQWRQAQEFARRAIELSAQGDTKEVAAQYATEQALRGAVFGDCRAAQTAAAQGLMFARGRASLPRAALALALCGEVNQARSLVDELSKRYPEDTLVNSIWLPAIRAALSLQRGDAAQAIEQLQTASRYEAAAEFWPQYLRGQAYLQLKQSTEAAAEFHKILDHRGQAPLSMLYPLGQLGLARAAWMNGDAHKSYEAFFTLWKDADRDLPVLIEAKREYEKLK